MRIRWSAGRDTSRRRAYKVAERYGIWVCKDFIPAERVNVLLPGKGSEFLKFHAFFNRQAIRLSADRTSIGPTPPAIRAAIEEQTGIGS